MYKKITSVFLLYPLVALTISYPRESRGSDENLVTAEIQRYRSLYPRYRAGTIDKFPKGRCVNINIPMETKSRSKRRHIVEKAVQAGVKTIRIPLDIDNNTHDMKVDPTYIEEVRDIADYAAGLKLNVVLNFARYPKLNKEPQAEMGRFLSAWEQVSSAWKSLSHNVMFEIFNEPSDNLDGEIYNGIIEKSVEIIRRNNRDRYIIVGAPWVSHYKGLEKLKFPSDENIIPSIHYYDPMKYTHQGANWIAEYRNVKASFGSEADLVSFHAAITAVNKFIDEKHVVPMVGEFGVTKSVPLDQRVGYMTLVAEGFSSIGVQTCAWTWDYKPQSFPLEMNGVMLTGMASALIEAKQIETWGRRQTN